jgi:2-oxoglutarate dehydrogenase E1 component
MLTICKCRQFATDVTQEDIDNTHKKVNLILNEEFLNRKDYVPHRRDWLSSHWSGFKSPEQLARIQNTGYVINLFASFL